MVGRHLFLVWLTFYYLTPWFPMAELSELLSFYLSNGWLSIPKIKLMLVDHTRSWTAKAWAVEPPPPWKWVSFFKSSRWWTYWASPCLREQALGSTINHLEVGRGPDFHVQNFFSRASDQIFSLESLWSIFFLQKWSFFTYFCKSFRSISINFSPYLTFWK